MAALPYRFPSTELQMIKLPPRGIADIQFAQQKELKFRTEKPKALRSPSNLSANSAIEDTWWFYRYS
jgi:hypothetical protein